MPSTRAASTGFSLSSRTARIDGAQVAVPTIMRMSDSTELRYAGLFEVREAKVARAPHSRGPQRRGAVNWEESER
jgi:hypothetical protein